MGNDFHYYRESLCRGSIQMFIVETILAYRLSNLAVFYSRRCRESMKVAIIERWCQLRFLILITEYKIFHTV